MSHPEGVSFAELDPDATVLVTGWHVNVGPGTITRDGQRTNETRIVVLADMIGERLRDFAPMRVALVIPVEEIDRFMKRLAEARDIGMPMHELEEGL